MRNNAPLAKKVICDNPPRMGRPPQWSQNMQARFRAGTFERIAKVLAEGEDRTDLVREAVERELERREKLKS
jgi:hypothetical protein